MAHVFMGANVPFGAVQLGPTSIPQSWDWTSGYHISDTTVIGFSHTHLNGTGIGDLFDVTVMPVVGQVTYARGTEDDPQSGMWSYFSHANEKARPGYYATRLDRYGIDVELTATKRVGLHKYTFPASADAAVVFDLENGGCWDASDRNLHRTCRRPHTISGYRYSTGWAKDQPGLFHGRILQTLQVAGHLRGRRGRRPARRRQLQGGAPLRPGRFRHFGRRDDLCQGRHFAREHRECTPEHAGRASRLGLRSDGRSRPTGRGTPSCRRCASRLRTTPHAAFSIRRFTTRWSPRPNSAT